MDREGGVALGWFSRIFGVSKKGSSSSKRRPRRLPEKVLAPVEEIVEQGVLVDGVAIRMSVKNSIIMNALKRNVDYQVDEIHDLVREQAFALVEERERDAKHIARVRDEIKKYGRSAWQETEYGSRDMKTLKHREEVYEGLARELRSLAEQDEFVHRSAEQAREAAWREIGDSLKERASHPYYSGGSSPEYQSARDDRIREFIDEDLTELIRSQKGAAGGFFKRKSASSKDH